MLDFGWYPGNNLLFTMKKVERSPLWILVKNVL